MQETDYITLELYLDGALSTVDKAALELRINADPQMRQTLVHLKQARALRLMALQSYVPDTAEALELADSAMTYCMENQHSPLGRIFYSVTSYQLFKRVGMVAACLLIAASSYWAGRGSVALHTGPSVPAASSIIGYTVQISTPSGQVVSQSFATYQQAAQFAQTYTADEQAASNQPTTTTTPQVASASATGVF